MQRFMIAALVALLPVQSMAMNESNTQLISGNSLLITNRFAPTTVYFDPAGTFLASAGSKTQSGTWRVTTEGVCASVVADGASAPEFCIPLPERNFGVTWEMEDPRNGKVTYKLIKGRHMSG